MPSHLWSTTSTWAIIQFTDIEFRSQVSRIRISWSLMCLPQVNEQTFTRFGDFA